jgi:hypothetical protein
VDFEDVEIEWNDGPPGCCQPGKAGGEETAKKGENERNEITMRTRWITVADRRLP